MNFLNNIFEQAEIILTLEEAGKKENAEYFKRQLFLSLKHQLEGNFFAAANNKYVVVCDFAKGTFCDVLHFESNALDNFLKKRNEIKKQIDIEVEKFDKFLGNSLEVNLENLLPNTVKFMKHIFGEQIEMGYDYMQLLYKYPRQKLPILYLVSKENKTGKSTFIKWISQMFWQISKIMSHAEFESEFNLHITDRFIICCEEFFLFKKSVFEKLTHISTAKNMNGNFIFTSSDEENFINYNGDDLLFWVRKVPVIKLEDPIFLERLFEEIPQFFNFLSKREMNVKKSLSQMWFNNSNTRIND